tara:strand:- start:3042 stop:3467 length:426 start_codon:yes stop_codon:yes gene_type:complete
MLSTRDIRNVVVSTKKDFDRLHKVDCDFELISEEKFWKLARQSKIIQFELENYIPLKVGSLVVHGEKDIVVFSKDVLNKLRITNLGLKALVMHELYHVLNKKRVRNNFRCCVESEERVHELFREEFPMLARKLDHLENSKL